MSEAREATEVLATVNGSQQLITMSDLLAASFSTDADAKALAPGMLKLKDGVYDFEIKKGSFVSIGLDQKLGFQLDVEVKDCVSRKDGGDVTEFVGRDTNITLWGHNIEFEAFLLQVAYVCRLVGISCNGQGTEETLAKLAGKRIMIEVAINAKGFPNFDWDGAKGIKQAL